MLDNKKPVLIEKLLSERYRFRKDYIPFELTQNQKDARSLFLNEVHKKDNYTQTTECPYCGYKVFNVISKVERRGLPSEIVICDSCDGCFKSAILKPDANKFHYEKVSLLLRGKELDENSIKELFKNRVKQFAYPRYYFILHFLRLLTSRDIIMEFGCNDGANLFPWKENGFEVFGIDLDSHVVEFGKKIGLNIACGDFLNYDFSYKKPKLIIISHVLEHVRDINLALDRLYEIIRPDGYIFIESPGIRVHSIRNPLAYFDIEHNYNFDLASLRRLLLKKSFKMIYADEYIRIICTPSENKNIITKSNTCISFNKIKSIVLRNCIKHLNWDKTKLWELLKEGDANNIVRIILNRLQMFYFKYHYSAISNLGAKFH